MQWLATYHEITQCQWKLVYCKRSWEQLPGLVQLYSTNQILRSVPSGYLRSVPSINLRDFRAFLLASYGGTGVRVIPLLFVAKQTEFRIRFTSSMHPPNMLIISLLVSPQLTREFWLPDTMLYSRRPAASYPLSYCSLTSTFVVSYLVRSLVSFVSNCLPLVCD